MNKEKIPRSFGTHDGTFHADEVTACALLLLFNLIDEAHIVRTRDLEKLESCEYVCDVGGFYAPESKMFDHHQVDYTGPLSSAGMILLHLREQNIISPNEYQFFNHTIILGVDQHDNGQDPNITGLCTYSDIITNLTPIEYNANPISQEKAFYDALHFALDQLRRMWMRYQYAQSCRQIVAETMTHDRDYLLFDRGVPWMEIFFELGGEQHPAQFVIMPSGSHWKLRGIPPSLDHRMDVRVPLPQEWAGLLDEDLKKASGINGAVFCHKGRFISVWETREDAIKALEFTLNQVRANQRNL